MRKLQLLALFLGLGCSLNTFAQEESLLDLVDDGSTEPQYITSAFKSPRVVMTHSIENLSEGALDFRILHRFGTFTDGFKNFFGLDQASMRMSFDYGLTDDLTIGIGRTGRKRELDGFVKYRIVRQQQDKMPITVSYVAGMLCTTEETVVPGVENDFNNRLAYYHQVLVGSKISDALSLQFTPTYLHRNLSETALDPNDLIALGIGGRVKLTSRVALTADYHYVIIDNRPKTNFNPLSIGVDIETGGHVFQLHFSNAQGLNERAFLTETRSDWLKGDFMFGFNLSRTFQIKKPKIKGLQ